MHGEKRKKKWGCEQSLKKKGGKNKKKRVLKQSKSMN
jgi:hypothetical protein